MKEQRARGIFALGFIVILVFASAAPVILAVRYPVKPTDAGDGLGLLIGLVVGSALAIWCIGGIVVLRRYRGRSPSGSVRSPRE